MKEGKLQIHSENILPIIKKWLYSDKDIFLRELVSNASDALSKLCLLPDQPENGFDPETFRIEVKLDKEKKLLTIEDNGIGMTSDEVEEYITQLAFSGATDFLQKYQKGDQKDQMIGHFGLGFYSAFMVSSLVEIETKSYQEDAKAVHWTCDGSIDYQMKESTKTSQGTKITLHLEDDSYNDVQTLRPILTKYCQFMQHPIYLEDSRINETEPLWLKSPKDCTDQDYLDFYRKLHPMEMEDPIFWVHLNVDHPFNLQGILYFPKISARFDFQKSHIKLFSNRVYVTDECRDLFPEFLTVLRGAIDSSDIPLNVSRSTLQRDRTVRQLGSHIAKKVADKLNEFYKNDEEKFQKAWPDIETIIKLGALQDEKFYERVSSFLLWQNINKEWTTLEQYLDKHKDAYKKKIFYTTKETEFSNILEVYKQKEIEVIYGGGPVDNGLFNFLEGKLEIEFQRIDGGLEDIIIDSTKEDTLVDQEGKTESGKLASWIQSSLGNDQLEVEAKSLSSDQLPGFVMIDEKSRRLRDYFAMTQKEMPMQALGKTTFVVNTNNKLIKSLQGMQNKEPEIAKELVQQIYDLSLLSQNELHPDQLHPFVTKTTELLEKLSVKLDS